MVYTAVSDSQCGFRVGRGCVDMIFCICRLVEKAIEYNTKLFLLLDLHKAYDSVPMQSSPLVYFVVDGVPHVMIDLIWSLHDGMSSTVTVGGGISKSFSV